VPMFNEKINKILADFRASAFFLHRSSCCRYICDNLCIIQYLIRGWGRRAVLLLSDLQIGKKNRLTETIYYGNLVLLIYSVMIFSMNEFYDIR